MTAAPRVGVVIPTYNQADYLREALASVVAQTMPDWHAVVVNNFSEDHTRAVALSFADPRIELVDFANHGVIAASRNLGAARARAEWVAYLDSDDLWHPEKLARCLAVAGDGVDVVGHALNMVRGGVVERVHGSGPASRASVRSLIFEGSCATPSASLIRRDPLLRVGGSSEDPRHRTAEDYDMWLRLAEAGARFAFIDDVLTDYRLHPLNASGSAIRHRDATFAVIDDHLAKLKDRRWGDSLRLARRRARVYYGAARSLMGKGDRRGALDQLAPALALWPLSPRPWAALLLCLPGLRWVSVAMLAWVVGLFALYMAQFGDVARRLLERFT